MFVIFGWENVFKPIESLLETRCFNCKNHSNWSVWKETEWVSLFFINLIPLTNKYHIGCDVCGDSTILNTELAKKALKPSERNIQLHDEIITLIEKHQFSQMTEGQINYYKSSLENREP